MTIRTMDIEDFEKIYDLWIHTEGMGLNTTDDSREGIAQYLYCRNSKEKALHRKQSSYVKKCMESGSSTANAFKAHSEQGVVFNPSSALAQAIRKK